MKNKIHYTEKARRDLDDIWDYIVSELKNRTAAERIILKIADDIDQLESFAGLGKRLEGAPRDHSDYRFLVTGNYLSFYRVDGSDIYVDRVIYGKRDYLRILLEEEL